MKIDSAFPRRLRDTALSSLPKSVWSLVRGQLPSTPQHPSTDCYPVREGRHGCYPVIEVPKGCYPTRKPRGGSRPRRRLSFRLRKRKRSKKR